MTGRIRGNFTTTRFLDRWTPENLNGSIPRLQTGARKNSNLFNSFGIRDASYIRLKNIQLGYTFSRELLSKLALTKARIYIGASNVFTITDVESGIDPETFDGTPSQYPPISIYQLGINLGL